MVRAGMLTSATLMALVAGTLPACEEGKQGAPQSQRVADAEGSTRKDRCDALMEEYSKGRIVGGEPARPRSAPWQIAIMSEPDYSEEERAFDATLERGHECKNYLKEREPYELAQKCGGSYIGDGWIITAAHCLNKVTDPNGEPGNPVDHRYVLLGTQNLTVDDGRFPIGGVVIHSRYTSDNKMDDIALIKLRDDAETRARLEALEAEKRLAAIELMQPGDRALRDKEKLRVTGWGYMGQRHAERDRNTRLMDIDGNVQRRPAALQQLSINYLDDAACKRARYSSFGPGSICAGTLIADGTIGEGMDSCQGDSGGPLTRSEGGGQRTLVGLVSAGKGCGAPGMPAVYVRVSHYAGWIAEAKRAVEMGAVTLWPKSARD